MKMQRLLVIPLLCALLASNHVYSETTRRHEAHTHGTANINIAIENRTVLIELESPAVNIIGFEHRPRNDVQRQTITDALTLMNDVDRIVTFAKTHCRTLEKTLTPPFDDNSIQPQASQEHSEFHAAYTLECDNAESIRVGTVRLFEHFAGTETVHVRWISVNGQGTARLTRQSPVFEIE